MKRLFLLVSVCLMGTMSCVSRPELQSEKTAPQPPAEPANEAPVFLAGLAPVGSVPESLPRKPPSFDYSHVSEAFRTHARGEIQQLIGELDGIIENEDYHAWINSLDASYLEKISSKDFLAVQSHSPRLKYQKSLKNAEEYFKKVVVPSRVRAEYQINDIDIQFIPEEERVLAFLTTSAGQKLRLYELKNVGGTWKIAN
jgi:hypothetical protein